MDSIDDREWAAGVHAALFSLALILGSVFWTNRVALALILISQGLAYLSRVIQCVTRERRGLLALIITTWASVIVAVLAALVLIIVGPFP